MYIQPYWVSWDNIWLNIDGVICIYMCCQFKIIHIYVDECFKNWQSMNLLKIYSIISPTPAPHLFSCTNHSLAKCMPASFIIYTVS